MESHELLFYSTMHESFSLSNNFPIRVEHWYTFEVEELKVFACSIAPLLFQLEKNMEDEVKTFNFTIE